MKIAILGTGRMGSSLGRIWAQNGHAIFFGSRDEQRAAQLAKETGSGSQGMLLAEAAEQCEVALLAIPWYAFTDVQRLVENVLDQKVVIDCINPLRSSGSLALGHSWSAAEEIAKQMPRARVVKAFNHIYWTLLDAPAFGEQRASLFYCSNHDDAKQVAARLAEESGFDPVDAGPLKNARLLEPLGALWMQLAFTAHHGTDVAFKLLRRPQP